MHRTNHLRTTFLLAIAALALLASSPESSAQEIRIAQVTAAGPVREAGFAPAVSPRQLKRYGEVLSLDEAQSMVAEEMLDRYRQTFDAEAADVRRRMDEIREEAQATGDFSAFQQMQPMLEGWAKSRTRLEEEFFTNLKSLLTAEQLESWPRLERERRRAKLLPDHRLGGEGVDLALLVHGLDLDEAMLAEVTPVLERYAIDLDTALSSREAALSSLREEMNEAMGDDEALKRIWDDATKKRSAVRDVNRRYLQTIAALLGEEHAAILMDSFQRESYPLAFEPTKAEQMLEAALKLDSLSSDQATTLESMGMDLERQLEGLRARLIEEIRKEEEALPPHLTNLRIDNSGNRSFALVVGGNEEPYGGLLKDRFEASRRVIEQVRTVLTPEQLDAMPARDTAEQNHMVFRGFRLNL